MQPKPAPILEGWKLIGEASLPDSLEKLYRERVSRARFGICFWGSGMALALGVFVWLALQNPAPKGVEWIFVVLRSAAYLCLWVGGPGLLMLNNARNLTEELSNLRLGGYWVYEALTEAALESFRADVKAKLVGWFEEERSGERLVRKPVDTEELSPRLTDASRSMIRALAVPAVEITIGEGSDFSRIGGNPLAPRGFSWPQNEGRALQFIAQINLLEALDSRLPPGGFLYFFDDFRDHPFVFYIEGDQGLFEEVIGPIENSKLSDSRAIRFDPILSCPPADRPEIQELGLADGQLEIYQSLSQRYPLNQMFGFAGHLHDPFDMEAICHESSPTFSGDPLEWKLLLQIDAEDAQSAEWSEGTIYFWIREEDLANRNFGSVQSFYIPID